MQYASIHFAEMYHSHGDTVGDKIKFTFVLVKTFVKASFYTCPVFTKQTFFSLKKRLHGNNDWGA